MNGFQGNSSNPLTSVIVPALNEENTIQEVIDRLLSLHFPLEIIVVDDGSRDSTNLILLQYQDKIRVLTNPEPQGKGRAIRSALEIASGEIIAIQDADLEYRPEEIFDIVQPIVLGQSDFVLGTRFINGMPKSMALPNKMVNILLAWAVKIFYGQKITDEATCYKAIKTAALKQMDLQCNRFEFCPEVVAKAIRLKLRIQEVPISYSARSKEAGKKIRWTDAPIAFWTLLKYRFWKSK